MSDVSDIRSNLNRIRDEMDRAARRAARRAEDVRLIAVSKTQPWHRVAAAIEAGQCDFGENTLQDAVTKIPMARDLQVDWHFIGHLQSNKAADIPENFTWVHSVDSLRLAQKLSAHAEKTGHPVNILIQVNLTRETHKSGVLPEHLSALMDALQAAALPGVNPRGLMTLGPRSDDEGRLRNTFAQLRHLRDEIAERSGLKHFTELSMGMSGDYSFAIMEGATLVRIGSALFGARPTVR